MRSATQEVWFVTGSQHLYGPAALAQVARNSQVIADSLDEEAALPVRIVFKPVLTTAEEILHLCRDRWREAAEIFIQRKEAIRESEVMYAADRSLGSAERADEQTESHRFQLRLLRF